MMAGMKIEDAIRLDHAGSTREGTYGYHVVVTDKNDDEFATDAIVRWWSESDELAGKDDGEAWERPFEINRDHGVSLIAWGPGNDEPPRELATTLVDYVAENLSGPLGDPRHG
jgi:hypothetical protein